MESKQLNEIYKYINISIRTSKQKFIYFQHLLELIEWFCSVNKDLIFDFTLRFNECSAHFSFTLRGNINHNMNFVYIIYQHISIYKNCCSPDEFIEIFMRFYLIVRLKNEFIQRLHYSDFDPRQWESKKTKQQVIPLRIIYDAKFMSVAYGIASS